MKVDITFPLWTDNWIPADKTVGPKNDGAEVTNVIKITVDTTDSYENYYGFWVPRGEPFMKPNGNNEIEVLTNRANV